MAFEFIVRLTSVHAFLSELDIDDRKDTSSNTCRRCFFVSIIHNASVRFMMLGSLFVTCFLISNCRDKISEHFAPQGKPFDLLMKTGHSHHWGDKL